MQEVSSLDLVSFQKIITQQQMTRNQISKIGLIKNRIYKIILNKTSITLFQTFLKSFKDRELKQFKIQLLKFSQDLYCNLLE